MSTQYRLVQSGKTASGGCSVGQGSSEPVAPRIFFFVYLFRQTSMKLAMWHSCWSLNKHSVIELKFYLFVIHESLN
jgi:hypothetical protein